MSSIKERWMRLRNFQSRDFWAMVFARPLTILLLLPIADVRWITPNRITIVALLTKLAGIALLALVPAYAGGVWAAVLVNLGLVADNMDGTLARYRRCGTFFGSYLDKVSDAGTLILLFWAMGYRTYLSSGEPLDMVLPAMGIGGGMVAAYCRWVADRIETDIHLRKLASDGEMLQDWARRRLRPDAGQPPPERTLGDWIKWLGRAVLSILLFNEVDIFFWLALALVIRQPWLFTRVLCPFYALGMVVGPIAFALRIRRVERLDRADD
jgi:phosphatidylglycerophosphate synthase